MKNIIKLVLFGCLLLLASLPVLAAPVDAGFILNSESDSAYQQIKIERCDASVGGKSTTLYEGDYISGSLAAVKIQLNPGFKLVSVSDDTVRVVLDRTTSEKNLFKTIVDWITGGNRSIIFDTSRGAGVPEQYPKPGFYATLLPNQPVIFAWERPAKRFAVFNESGKMVYQKEVSEQAAISVTPEEIGLKPGKVYTWKVDSSNWDYKVALLDEPTAKKIKADLAGFDNETGSLTEKQLEKAAYLQLVSDIYGNKADLYWLSYQLTKEAKMTDKDMAGAIERLKERVSWHLNKQMSEVQ